MNIIEKTYALNGPLELRTQTDYAILHHAAASVCSADDVDRWHKNNGWECIGYHFFIRKDGSIYRGRKQNTIGAHAYGHNYNSIGICFEGNFEEEEMPEAQIEAGKWICDYIRKQYPGIIFKGHRDFNSTSCPGKNFKFDEIVNGQPVEPVNAPVSPKDERKEGKIASIQDTLNSRYGYNIAVDNIYGPETHTALVKALQTELNTQFNAGLVVDGIFGPKTKSACVVVERGDMGNITWLIQAMLIIKGYDLEADSIFGQITEHFVKQFQEKSNIEVDGLVGRETFTKLFA